MLIAKKKILVLFGPLWVQLFEKFSFIKNIHFCKELPSSKIWECCQNSGDTPPHSGSPCDHNRVRMEDDDDEKIEEMIDISTN